MTSQTGSTKCRVLGYVGDNHNGNPDLAAHLVDIAISAGCDGVVLTHRRVDSGYAKDALLQPIADGSHRQSTRGEVLQALELSADTVKELREKCRGRSEFVGAPYDLEALAQLEESEPEAYQVDPPVLGHIPLLEAIAATGRPVILVAGRCTEEDIAAAVGMFPSASLTLLHCVYATEVSLESTALWYLPWLQQTFGIPIGYMGLEPGIHASVAAFALGARTIEKSFTSDQFLPGPYHASSLDRDQLRELVVCLRQLENALQGEPPRVLLKPEVDGASDPQACLVAAHDLLANEMLGKSMLTVKLAPDGIHPRLIDKLIGRQLAYDVDADAPITFGVVQV